MRAQVIAIVFALLILAGCSDDPIIGPTDDTSGGGSYGVIHFNASPDGPPADTLQKENPKRF